MGTSFRAEAIGQDGHFGTFNTFVGRRVLLADLRGAILDGADLRDADVTLANLVGASLRNATITDARFQGINMGAGMPAGTDFSGADLTRSYVNLSNLTGCKFGDAVMRGTEGRTPRCATTAPAPAC